MLIVSHEAHATSCAPSSPAEHVAATDVIFFGTPVGEAEASGSDPGMKIETFRVEQTFKGVSADTIRIAYPGDDGTGSGVDFPVGTPTMVFADVIDNPAPGGAVARVTFCSWVLYHFRRDLHETYRALLGG